jgi:hypothetical protein
VFGNNTFLALLCDDNDIAFLVTKVANCNGGKFEIMTMGCNNNM